MSYDPTESPGRLGRVVWYNYTLPTSGGPYSRPYSWGPYNLTSKVPGTLPSVFCVTLPLRSLRPYLWDLCNPTSAVPTTPPSRSLWSSVSLSLKVLTTLPLVTSITCLWRSLWLSLSLWGDCDLISWGPWDPTSGGPCPWGTFVKGRR